MTALVSYAKGLLHANQQEVALPLVRVLLAEDDPMFAHLVMDILMASPRGHFQVSHAQTLADTVNLLSSRSFDVALLDLVLPDANGVALFDSVRAHPKAKDLPIIVLTALGDEELPLLLLSKGATDYLIKGDTSNSLLVQSMETAIARHHVLAELHRQAQKLQDMVQTHHIRPERPDSVRQALFSARIISESLPRIWKSDPREGQRGMLELLEISRNTLKQINSLLEEGIEP